MNILDGFSGIGGFTLGMQRAGIEIDNHYYSEIDKYAQQIYKKQFPGAVRLGDISTIGNEHGKIDIITGGFPCQTFSIAGKRRGFEDTRGTLFFEIERLARIYRPSYMVLENVKGLGNHDGGNTIRIILDKLRGLGFTVQLLLINTKDLGIPQNRERFFFICTARGKRQPEISGIRERKTEIAFSANCIDANYYKGIDNHGQRTCIAINTKQQGEPDYSIEQSQCLISSMYKEPIKVIQDSIIRRLTPTECERLQDYPDNWTEYGIDDNDNEVKISDSQRYKCCGNSITVKIAEEIFKEIKKVILTNEI